MYANTCWGFLSLAVGLGIAVIGLPADYVWLQPYFIGAAIICGVISVVLFSWVPAKALTRKVLTAATISHTLPINESNLMAYMRSDPAVLRLDEEIARTARLALDSEGSVAWPVLEEASLFGIATIGQLHSLLLENEEAVFRMSHYSYPSRSIARGHSLLYLFEVLGAQLGKEKFKEYRGLLRYSSGGTDNQISALKAISGSSRRWWKRKTRVPLADDFNLIPIEQALSMAFHQTRRSAFAKTVAANSKDHELLAYFQHLKDKFWLYGCPKGGKSRQPMPDMAAIMNPRFEDGKIIVDCQIACFDESRNPIATSSVYERLYVLRPTLIRAIDQLNEAKA